MKIQKIIASLVFFILSAQLLSGQPVSRDEYNALLQRLEAVEATLKVTRSAQVESIAGEALASVEMSSAEKSSLIENVVRTIQKREEKTVFPWMEAGKWTRLKKGMRPEDVIEVLGPPTLDEPSLHRRVDFVYTYEGRRVATNEKVSGLIRFYKGVAIEIEVPAL